ncbi:MAG TPA: hypothetical protein PLD84_10990 [Chitinophagales bacterium]|nr:hypothetical protein [Chitinophagales bacterium]
MNNQSINLSKIKAGALAVCIGLLMANASFAQEAPVSKEKSPQTRVQPVPAEKKQMSWEEYKADMQAKYQKVADQVSAIEKQAAEKKIDAPEFKEHVNKFQEQAKEFGIRMKNADVLPVERQEEFKADMKVQLDRLNAAYEELKNKWATLNK